MEIVATLASYFVAVAEGVALGLVILAALIVIRCQYEEQDAKYRARKGK